MFSLAVALSVLANAVVLTAALALDVAPGLRTVAWPPVLFLTVVGAVGAVVAYWALSRFSDAPDRQFTLLAAVVLVLSFVPDLVLLSVDPAATVAGVAVLMVMHVTVAAACVGALTRRAATSGTPTPTD
ncbi:DUF6069 family protein [Halorussus gelatinilyticus]|uniref:DUF6069 family protein n=1 Tax=Halorussus gelatinilyticus TaxID=2937524 RepID=A0A8U0IKE9_9EURY|nr:DUF6069 family protein [Halorussus gelatinilyticus]UPW01101.1 DUF6069 family protein [Halorussus gelatinilyticus]